MKKMFVEIYRLHEDGYNGEWVATNMTHDEAVAKMNGWNDEVRTIEKEFNPDTFKVEEKVIRWTVKDYEGKWT